MIQKLLGAASLVAIGIALAMLFARRSEDGARSPKSATPAVRAQPASDLADASTTHASARTERTALEAAPTVALPKAPHEPMCARVADDDQGAPPVRLDVRIDSASGEWSGKVVLRALARREAPRWIEREIDVRPGGVHALFEGLDPVGHRVELRAADGTWITPESRDGTPGGSPLHFTIADDLVLTDVAFEIVDAGGAPRDDVQVDVDLDRVPAYPDLHVHRRMRAAPWSVQAPQGARLAWTAWRDGLKPDWGQTTASAGAHVKVVLDEGWGADLTTLDESDHAIANVELALDGASVGTSDADGHLHVVRTSAPHALTVLGDQFEIALGGDVLPKTGVLRNSSPPVRVILRPRAH